MPRWEFCLGTVAALILAEASVFAQLSRHYVDPFDANSPSGSYVLRVDPSDADGWGPAQYTLERDGEVLWTKELDCTLQEVVIADDGVFAGMAEPPRESGGFDLRLMLCDPDGVQRYETCLPAEPMGFIHGPSFPHSAGTLLFPARNCVLFRVVHNDSIRGFDTAEEWRVVDCSTGRVISTSVPGSHLAETRGVSRFAAVQPIGKTPLVAAHALVLTHGPSAYEKGATFAVFDLDGKPVWERREAHDYEIPDDEEADGKLWPWVAQHGALLKCDQPGRFEFALAREGQRVLCEVAADPAQPGKWTVNEVDRSDYKIPFEDHEETGAQDYPPLDLELVGTIELRGTAPVVERVWSFDLDDRGRLGALVTAERMPPRFVLRKPDGDLVSDVTLQLGPTEEPWKAGVIWLKGDRWLVHASEFGDDARAHAWWLDLPSCVLTEVQDFECAPIDKADGTFDGGFAVLTSRSAEYTIVTTLSSFDAEGRLRWENVEAYGQSESGLFSPEGLAVSPKGEIGVVDNIKKVIQRFDLAGKLVGEIELEQVLGRKLRYPTDLGVDPNGNWVVYDFSGSPPVLRITRDAQLSASFAPKYFDGKAFRPVGGMRVAPNGALWTTDGFALLRLDANGVVDLVAGDAPSEEDLGTVEEVFIDHSGRILLIDSRTQAVHVFGSEGQRTAICRLAPEDVDARTRLRRIAVEPDGSIHVGPVADEQRRYRKFAPNGEPLRSEAFVGVTLFQPATGKRWQVDQGVVRLFAPDGAEQKQLSHSPDGRWFDYSRTCAVDSDGTLVVQSRDRYHLFAADGAPIRSLPIPSRTDYANLALSRSHVFAAGVASVWRTDLSTGAIQFAKVEAAEGQPILLVSAWREDLGELWLANPHTKQMLRYRVKD